MLIFAVALALAVQAGGVPTPQPPAPPPPPPQQATFGEGGERCTSWTAARGQAVEAAQNAWFRGYLFRLDEMGQGDRVGEVTQDDLVHGIELMSQFCRQNPEATIGVAAREMAGMLRFQIIRYREQQQTETRH